MDRSKVIEKIQKCLALSKSSEPHEAAAALRQAQKLMTTHSVTAKDIGLAEYSYEKVSCPIQVNKNGNSIPVQLAHLVSLIMSAFGVTATIETELRISDLSYAVRYFGPKARIQIAAYCHTIVYRAMEAGWKTYLTEHDFVKGARGARLGFYIGWLDTVRETVRDFEITSEEKEQTALVKSQYYGKENDSLKSRSVKVQTHAMLAGKEAGKDFRLHRPVK